jgi:hypothetical protein
VSGRRYQFSEGDNMTEVTMKRMVFFCVSISGVIGDVVQELIGSFLLNDQHTNDMAVGGE